MLWVRGIKGTLWGAAVNSPCSAPGPCHFSILPTQLPWETVTGQRGPWHHLIWKPHFYLCLIFVCILVFCVCFSNFVLNRNWSKWVFFELREPCPLFLEFLHFPWSVMQWVKRLTPGPGFLNSNPDSVPSFLYDLGKLPSRIIIESILWDRGNRVNTGSFLGRVLGTQQILYNVC